MNTFYLKYRDVLPVLEVTLLGADETVYDLSGAKSVVMHIKGCSGRIISRYMNIYSAINGVVRYTWSSTDWTSPGVEIGQNLMEYEVLTSGLTRLTFPNDTYDTLSVISDLAQGVTS